MTVATSLQSAHMLQFFGKLRLNIKIQPLYILFEAEFYADVKTGFIFDVRQKYM
jgi:hypothetical protein